MKVFIETNKLAKIFEGVIYLKLATLYDKENMSIPCVSREKVSLDIVAELVSKIEKTHSEDGKKVLEDAFNAGRNYGYAESEELRRSTHKNKRPDFNQYYQQLTNPTTT